MHLIQLFLPLSDNQKRAFDGALFAAVRDELSQRFGGVTAYTRAPASGLWREQNGEQVRDDLAIYEVMADTLDKVWWTAYRESLERRFRQEAVLIRAHVIQLL